MILLNETSRKEANNRLEKGEKNNLFSGNNYIAKEREKLSSGLSNIMETKWNVFIYL